MHVLVIPSEIYGSSRFPLSGIFQRDQIEALVQDGKKIGVLNVCRFSAKYLLNSVASKACFVDSMGVNVFYDHYKKILPGKYIKPLELINEYQKHGLNLFEAYVNKHGPPDFIHAHNIFFGGCIAFVIKEKWGVPYLLTEHSSAFACHRLKQDELTYGQKVCMRSSMLTAVSKGFANKLTEAMSLNMSISILPNVLEKRFLEQLPGISKESMKSRSFIFVNVASLDSNKDHEVLIKAFAQAFKNQKNVKLQICGEGPLGSQLKNMIVSYGVEHQVILLGRLEREAIQLLLQNADIMVLSSKTETFGVVLIEALSQGMPIIATATAGATSIVNNDNGLLVPVGNVHALSKAFIQLKNNIKSYNAQKIRSNCLSLYGQAAFVDMYNELAQAIIQDRKCLSNSVDQG